MAKVPFGEVKVISVLRIKGNIYVLTFTPGLGHQSGQFVSICCPGKISPLPFCLMIGGDSTSQVIFDVKGMGTAWLAERKPGDILDVLGPLGNGFSVFKETKTVLLVAGGMGIVPILELSRHLIQDRRCYVKLLYGARDKEHLLSERHLPVALEVLYFTDDGSCGEKGLVTDRLGETIEELRPDQIFACGPKAMLAEVKRIIEPYSISCRVVLETIMGCGGQGHCRGCIIERVDGTFVHLCEEGPVFDIIEVKL
ncbi:MAG: hypothetical protein NT135_00825 [Candidatus Berkelbacteria bacterium]|nr:hypothetical protein [Candidatus Berkelbacteria bacterium]